MTDELTREKFDKIWYDPEFQRSMSDEYHYDLEITDSKGEDIECEQCHKKDRRAFIVEYPESLIVCPACYAEMTRNEAE